MVIKIYLCQCTRPASGITFVRHSKSQRNKKSVNEKVFGRMGLGIMMFNAIFNNISVISWMSVLLVEETGVSGENHRPAASD
jgi:hypothetical protein